MVEFFIMPDLDTSEKNFITINSIDMKENNQMQNEPGCCLPGSDCCSGLTEMGCC
jgi:hypothetical protein